MAAVVGAPVVVAAVAVVCGFVWMRWRRRRSAEEVGGGIPGSMGWPVVGETFSFIADFSSPAGVLSFMRERQRRYGKVFKTSVLGRTTVFVTGREAAKILMSGKDGGAVTLNLSYAGRQVLGPASLLGTNGEAHRNLRRLIGQPLSVDALKKHFAFINGLAVQTLAAWSGRRRVLVLDEASSFTLKVIGNMLVSLPPAGEEQEKFRANFKLISSSFASLPFKLPGTAFHSGLKARNRMYAMLDAVIRRRRHAGEVRDDFLQTLLMKKKDVTGAAVAGGGKEADEEKLTDAQLKDNILTLLVAGHDTTTAGLTWVLKFLGENPPVLRKLREEHLEIRERRNGAAHLRWSDMNDMPYTVKVMNETLRMATILPWFSRVAAEDFTVDGYEVKKGTSVNLDVVSIHHDAAVFAEPERFAPERFDGQLRPYSFLGFGSGPRMCPGMSLAKLEICVFLHHLVCRYDWKPMEEDDSVQATLVRMPKNKYPIVVTELGAMDPTFV